MMTNGTILYDSTPPPTRVAGVEPQAPPFAARARRRNRDARRAAPAAGSTTRLTFEAPCRNMCGLYAASARRSRRARLRHDPDDIRGAGATAAPAGEAAVPPVCDRARVRAGRVAASTSRPELGSAPLAG
jgi:hypothetical protein